MKIVEILVEYMFFLVDNLKSKKKIIVFACRSAKDYADNSKILFEYFLDKNEENVYFYTKRKDIFNKIPKNGIYAYSIKGVWVLLNAKIFIFTHGHYDFSPYLPKKIHNRIYINLFHAIAIKKVGYHNCDDSKSTRISKIWDYFLVSSEFESEFIQRAYCLKKNQIINFGQPRNDILYKSQEVDNTKKTILYAPTFRDISTTILFPFKDRALTELDAFLGSNNYEIMIRMHINEEAIYKDNIDYLNLKHIYFANSNVHPSVNDILHKIDYLITYYSSISLDYLIKDKPIAYIPYDYKDYEKIRGFSFPYFDNLAGPVLNSQKDLMCFLKLKKDEFKNKRLSLRNKFHQNTLGNSTELLYKFVKTL